MATGTGLLTANRVTGCIDNGDYGFVLFKVHLLYSVIQEKTSLRFSVTLLFL